MGTCRIAKVQAGRPRENGHCESFNSKLRDQPLNGEFFYSLATAKVIIEAWRSCYNSERPHSSLGYRPPAPKATVWPAPPRGSTLTSARAMAAKPIMHTD